jgi:hypothetical protein
VVVHRPAAVGDRLIQSGEVRVTIGVTVTALGQTLEDEYEDIRAQFTLEREVLAVSPGGEATRVRSHVRSFAAKANGEVFDPLGPGAVIETIWTGGEIDHSGIPLNLSDGETIALEAVLIPLNSTSRTDQAMFRAPDRVSVGEEWPIDLEILRKDFSNEVLDLRSTKFRSAARLLDLRTVGGVECLYVDVEAEGEGVVMRNMPRGTVVDQSSLFFSYTLTLPRDRARRVREAQVMLSSNLSATVQNQGTVAGVYSVRADYSFEYPDSTM